MNKKNKDIYELLNEVEFDITEEPEIPMDDIRKKRIKNRIKDKIKKKVWWKNKSFIAMVALIVLIITVISPAGKRVIAEIKEKFFYNPGLGIVNVKEDIYVLTEPIMLDSNGREILIKSITSNSSGISIELWVNDGSLNNLNKEEILNEEIDIEEILKIITPNGDELTTGNYGRAGGGSNTCIGAYFESDEILNEFSLKVYDLEVKNIKLSKVNEVEDFENIGFNDEDNNLIIGGNKYIFRGETYISLWTDEEFKDKGVSSVFFDKNDIITMSVNEEKYEILPSDYSGTGKEFVINKEINEAININIHKVELDYNLKKPIKITEKIPKKGEEIEVNKEIYIEELDETLILKSIKRTDEDIEAYFDTGTMRKENSDLIILGGFRSSYGIGASPDNRIITFGIHDEDLTFIEKLTGKVRIEIRSVTIDRYGSWNFTIE